MTANQPDNNTSDNPPAPDPTALPEPAAPADDGGIAVAGVDPTRTRTDGRCLPEGSEESIEYTLAYQVVDGVLGSVCFGSPDETVEGAWRVLADLTPPDQLRDLAVFGGFTSSEEGEVTLAFTQQLDNDGTQFLLAVNTAQTRADSTEAVLTMAHVFSYVFTALPAELNRLVPSTECLTYHNGEGCYEEDAIMNRWYQEFWLDAPGDPTDPGDAGLRCDLNEGYFGSYAASYPEADFAEAFSAYVLQLDARTEGQQQRLDFIDSYTRLREFRDRAIALGYESFENRFGLCG